MINFDLKREKILVVDDQQANIDVIKALLYIDGYTDVEYTTDSRSVIELVKTFKPDLILLDLIMPYLSGFEVMKLLKEQQLKSVNTDIYLPILVLTADISLETKQKALASGAKDFVSKPFDLIEVRCRIKNLLETKHLIKKIENRKQFFEQNYIEKSIIYNNEINSLKLDYNYSLLEIDKKNNQLLISNSNSIKNDCLLEVVKKELVLLFDKNKNVEAKIDTVVDKIKIKNRLIENSVSDEFLVLTEPDFVKKLKLKHPDLTNREIRLCSFYRMGYDTKEVANISYMNYKAVKKSVFRIRKKLSLIKQGISLTRYLQGL
jgi:CheY-like chemotaxis protein/DNA-binding CsgD family transcriptional regulator